MRKNNNFLENCKKMSYTIFCLLHADLILSGRACGKEYMRKRKIFALLIAFIMLVNMYTATSAAEPANNKLLATFTVDEQGNLSIQPRNTDLAAMSDSTNLVKFWANSGMNIKIHLYISSAATNVYVHFHEGNSYATSSDTVKAVWSGTGHKYADLKLNASGGYYSVYLRGGFVGSGAVYAEP